MQNQIKNIFGTDGIRGQVGNEPLSNASLQRLGCAIGVWIQNKYGKGSKLLMAHDTRVSSSFVKAALTTGLLGQGISIVDGHILPTPAVVQLLHYEKNAFQAGLVISASHNPYQDNGIKIIKGGGEKLTEQDEEDISALFFKIFHPDYGCLGVSTVLENAQKVYTDRLISFFPPAFLKDKKIVLDCAQGAVSALAGPLFQIFGATVIVINDQPDGFNINRQCGALYPQMLQKAVVEHGADAGFSFDGDGDRVITVNRWGAIKDGDDILAILLRHPAYAHSSIVVGTIMSNQGLEEYLISQQKILMRSVVGDKYVAQMMSSADALLGGEPSGHIIARDYLTTGDGLFIALRVCQTLDLINDWDMAMFAKFPQILINLIVPCRRDLQDPLIGGIVSQSRSLLTRGRLIVRYSGTEPLLRIMVEDSDYDHALSIGNHLSRQLQELFSY